MGTRWIGGGAAALALFVTAAAVSEGAPQDPPFRGKVTGSNVNIRMSPGREGLIVRVAGDGESLLVTGREGTWYRIVPPENAWCWIPAADVKKTEGGTIVRRDTVLRQDSRINAPAVGQIASGEQVKILAEKVDWYKIQAPPSVAMYIHADYVAFDRAYDPDKDGPIIAAGGKEPKSGDAPAGGAKEGEAAKAAEPTPEEKVAQRNAEIEKLKREYDRINKEYQDTVKKIAAEKEKAPAKAYDATGVVDTVGLFLGRPGTHALVSGKKIVCYLKSADPEKLDLNRFYGRLVGVQGKSEAARGYEPLQVITVESVDVIVKD